MKQLVYGVAFFAGAVVYGIVGAVSLGAPATRAAGPQPNYQVVGAAAPASRTITSGASDTTQTADVTIKWVKTTGSASAESVPACGTSTRGRLIIVKDGKGDAATNHITVTPVSGTIDGASNYVVSTNYGVLQIQCDGGTDWSIIAKI